MSDNRLKEETLNSEDALNMFKKNCKSFLDMNSQEKSEGIKINYLIGLIKLSDNLKIDEESFINTLFEEILFKDLTILKNHFRIFINNKINKNSKKGISPSKPISSIFINIVNIITFMHKQLFFSRLN